MSTGDRIAPFALGVIAVVVCLLAAGCAQTPRQPTASTTRPGPEPAQHPMPQIAPTTATRRAIMAAALAQLGTPYRANTAGPSAFDDSGLAYFAYHQAEARLARTAREQLDAGKPIEMAQAQPADLVFFRIETRDGGDRLLVGLYVRPGQVLVASPGANDTNGVTLLDASAGYWQQRQLGVIRILPPRS